MSVNNYEQSELLVLYGQTTGAGGTVSLTSDVIVSPQTKFVFPKGMTAKVRTKLMAGNSALFNFQYANDGSTFRTVNQDALPSTAIPPVGMAEVFDSFRAPLIFRSMAGTEAMQITWELGASGGTFASIAVNISLEQDPVS